MIGNQPVDETIVLVKGQGWDEFLTVPEDDPIPDDTTVSLTITDRRDLVTLGVWPAVSVVGGGAQFNIDSDDCDAIPAFSRFRIHISYPGNQPKCWYRGTVIRKD